MPWYVWVVAVFTCEREKGEVLEECGWVWWRGGNYLLVEEESCEVRFEIYCNRGGSRSTHLQQYNPR